MFDIDQKLSIDEARLMNAVVLAYIGDGVQSLYVRKKLAYSSTAKTGELNKREAKIVCATAQARAAAALEEQFTEEELGIYKRAKNSKKGSKAKNESAKDYVKSTGFEAVIGYLYITGQTERVNTFLEKAEEFAAQ